MIKISKPEYMLDSVKYELINTLEEIGIVLGSKDDIIEEEDIDLRDYIEDSLIFISTIVQIETTFEVEIPDEILHFDILKSLTSFSNILLELLENKDAQLELMENKDAQ